MVVQCKDWTECCWHSPCHESICQLFALTWVQPYMNYINQPFVHTQIPLLVYQETSYNSVRVCTVLWKHLSPISYQARYWCFSTVQYPFAPDWGPAHAFKPAISNLKTCELKVFFKQTNKGLFRNRLPRDYRFHQYCKTLKDDSLKFFDKTSMKVKQERTKRSYSEMPKWLPACLICGHPELRK